MKETDILVGHVPCSTLPQKDYNIDHRDTLEESNMLDFSSHILSLCHGSISRSEKLTSF